MLQQKLIWFTLQFIGINSTSEVPKSWVSLFHICGKKESWKKSCLYAAYQSMQRIQFAYPINRDKIRRLIVLFRNNLETRTSEFLIAFKPKAQKEPRFTWNRSKCFITADVFMVTFFYVSGIPK